ncbi:MAG: transcriptional repressor, LexA family [Candidatus Doudnabacteria bacterium Gr01-1014_77]|uniref:LexA repressor n=1 Tax=Candidatus Doudnabacteria bacterium Gr01-1014_77 TaxID=2017133 RepID=A0A554JAP8_9BACT|nr:MAG: transcriptional repressor, LexA family [Candidatus Doudnabacteria bacterium Gr01-1014_77]
MNVRLLYIYPSQPAGIKPKIMDQLTEKQASLLNFIISEIREHSLPPSISEMAKFLKVKSKNAVSKLLDQLEEKEYIQISGKARGIKVLETLGKSIQKGMFSVPILGNIQAGMPMLAEEHIEDWINLPQTLTRNRQDVFLLRVRGDSMKNAGILEGDLVIVKPTKDVKNNDIVVALLRDEATVKRFIKIQNRVYLKPENDSYKNIYPQSEWTVQGKVVGVIRNLE